MKILITGGTGFIGSKYAEHRKFLGDDIVILTRDVEKAKSKLGDSYSYVDDLVNITDEIDVIINLAGEPINGWWSKNKQINIIKSRVNTTKMVEKLIDRLAKKPSIVITASAIGIYPESIENSLDENSGIGIKKTFSYQICKLWEDAAKPISFHGVRLCIARLGVVIDKSGGLLKTLNLPFKMGLGAIFGSGEQYISWIHLKDVIKIFDFMISNENLEGVFNLTNPNYVTNKEFSEKLAKKLKRPLFFRIPKFILKFIFGESIEELALKSQKIYPKNLIYNHYKFEVTDIENAIE